MKEGDTHGQWTLDCKIGEGGNGSVWRANGPDGHVVAMKFLMRFDRYARFRDEVKYQSASSMKMGILPLLDSHLPDLPTKGDRPWIATPISTGLLEFVEQSEKKLVAVITVVRDIAVALAGIHADGVAHRDIKPENLFVLNGNAVIGDFGLVSYPGKQAVTVSGERLGPIYYVAPELLGNESEEQDFRAGDVYSLAKTMWVLATGQRFPLPGTLDIAERACRLSSFVRHDRAVFLDTLLDSATAFDPAKRPSCREFADELAAWLDDKHVASDDIRVPPETAAQLRQFAKLAATQRNQRELSNEELPKILSALHEQLVEIGRRFAETVGITANSPRLPDGNTNIALPYFPYGKIPGHDGVGNRCFQEVFESAMGRQFVAIGGVVLERIGHTHGLLTGGPLAARGESRNQPLTRAKIALPYGRRFSICHGGLWNGDGSAETGTSRGFVHHCGRVASGTTACFLRTPEPYSVGA